MADYSMGGLLGMPSMEVTEEDKRQALKQMLMQMGMGMVANSHKGNQAALGAGLLGGVQGYQQGMQGPMNRFEMAKQQLDFQGKQLGNAKAMRELQDQQGQAAAYGNAASGAGNSALNSLSYAGQLNGANGPAQQQIDNVGGYDSLYQDSLRKRLMSPDMVARIGASGGDVSKISSLISAMQPQQVAAGGYSRDPLNGQMTYNADPVKGIGMGPQGVYNLPGSVSAAQERLFADEAIKAKFNDWLKQQEAGRDTVTLPNNGRPEVVLRSQVAQKLGGQPSQNIIPPDATYSNAEALRMYNQMPDGAEKQSLGRALQGAGQRTGGMGTGLSQAEEAAQKATALLGPEAQKIATAEGLKASIDRIGKSKDLAKSAIDSSLSLQQAVEATKSGAYQGRFADWQTAGAAVMSALPGLSELVDPKKLANSQTAGAHLSEQILGKIKTLGANPSNADREYITKTVAQLTNDPAAFTRLTNYMQSMTMRSLESHNSDASRIHAVKGFDPTLTGTDYSVNVPPQLVEARQRVLTVFKHGTPEQKKQLRALGYVE